MTSSFALLERIADALGLPITAFFEDDEPMDEIAQTIHLVAAFATIKDPAARRECLAFVRTSAGLTSADTAEP